ncbi:MAG: pitrilysin family protein [Thermoanaerobaculia bacterium]
MTHEARAAILLTAVLVLTATVGVAQMPDRSAPPALGPPPSLDLPPLTRFELANGVDVVVLERHRVPVAQALVLVRAGAVDDPEGKAGLARMTAAMLDEGAAGRSALELGDLVQALGAELTTESTEHATRIGLFVPTSHLEAALGLLADVVARPDFPAEELERQRLDALTEQLQARDEPRAIARAELAHAVFGPHPYGRTPDATSVGGLTVDDVRAFHQAYFRPDNATLVLVGDVTEAAVRPLLEDTFGSWTGAEEGRRPAQVGVAPQVEGRTIYLVDKPGAAQSEIRIGRVGFARSTEDYFALTVMNTVLGGSFTSRLNSNLREDKGYSYGAGSGFTFLPTPGPFVAAAAVQTDVTDKALAEFMKELEGISSIGDEELERARNYVALRYPRRFETVSDTADRIAELVLFDLPDDTFNRTVPSILAVTREQAEAAARRAIDPGSLAIVVVGDREVIESGIAALGLGDIVDLTVDDVLGPAPAP